MNLATARSALATIVTAATGIPATSLFWQERPRGWAAPPLAVLRLTAAQEHGTDEVIHVYDPAAPLNQELTPRQVGLRRMTWTVQIWSQRATDAGDALALCEALRDRLRLPENTDRLKAAGLGLAGIAALTDLGVVQDDRTLSVAQVDVLLNADANTAGTPIGYVETWQITGTAETETGGTIVIVNNERLP